MENEKYIGRLLDGRYEILELIGIGGMAEVYKARCHRLNRLVAIKILKEEYSQDEEFRRRFHGESQAVAMFSHPNIVSVYDVSSSGDGDYIVMELIDGITLKQYMEKKGTLNWKETLHFAIQIAKALEHAHGRGIVHRDIKPHNVMVLKNGSVKVADFGIAQVMTKSNTLTKEALGSVHYISPEQAKGGRVDNRSDLYSLGVVMYEMITGRVPYDGESPVSIAIQHISGGAVKPSLLNPNIPKGLEQIIRKAMALSPTKRYATATAMLYDMDEFRKEPTMVFVDVPVPVDGATRPLPTEEELAAHPPQTIAERTAAEKKPVAPPPPRKPTEPKPQEKEEERNRVATIAITSCVVVGVVAIIIIAVILAGILGKDNTVTVPYLVGMRYDAMGSYEGIEVVEVEGGGQYSDVYEKGVIMDQRPRGGDKVVNPTKVFVTVSKGAEPPAVIMEDLTDGVTLEAAKTHLDGLKLELNILPKYETSNQPKGYVIRTDPAAGTELTKGQTVTLWVSSGPPESVKAEMPNVVGRTYEEAVKILNANGFMEVRQNPVDSEKPKDTVVAQSEEKFTKIDVTTIIVLDVSTGVPDITEDPSDPVDPDVPADPVDPDLPTDPGDPDVPTTPPEDTTEPVTKEVAFIIPSMTESYKLTIMLNGQVYREATIQPGVNSYVVPVTGTGVQTYVLYVNDVEHGTQEVDFEIDG